MLIEVNKLISKRDEIKNELKNSRKQLANITEYGSKQLLRLGMTTKKVYEVKKPISMNYYLFFISIIIFLLQIMFCQEQKKYIYIYI